MCKMRRMDINCWQSCSGSEKGHIARGNRWAGPKDTASGTLRLFLMSIAESELVRSFVAECRSKYQPVEITQWT